MDLFSFDSEFGHKVLSIIQNYNHEKYWRRRSVLVNPQNKTPFLLKLYYLWYIKKKDAFHHCSFGTNMNSGAYFSTPPPFISWTGGNNCRSRYYCW